MRTRRILNYCPARVSAHSTTCDLNLLDLKQRFPSLYFPLPTSVFSLFHSLLNFTSISTVFLLLLFSHSFPRSILSLRACERVQHLRDMSRSSGAVAPRWRGFQIANPRNMYSMLIILLAVLELGTVPQQSIGFYCNDPKLSFKFMGDTVSVTLLLVGCLLMPIVVISLAEYTCYPASSYDMALGCAGTRAKQICLWYGHYLIGIISLTFICDVMKTMVGEPRPHFLDTCRPREAENCTNKYVEKYTCTNTVDSQWFISDSSKSFPSGHSALSMFATIFVVWYLHSRLPNRTFFLKPWLQCMVCLWTVMCSLSRVVDNRHHWWDVLAGIILGLAFSVLTITIPCRKFQLNRNVSQIYNDPIENGQISFNNKTQQSVKKLLHDATADLPESRELKNIKSTTWKE